MWPISRRHGDVGTETHNILHTIKMGRLWPVMAILRQLKNNHRDRSLVTDRRYQSSSDPDLK
jgi:hypothetical protein